MLKISVDERMFGVMVDVVLRLAQEHVAKEVELANEKSVPINMMTACQNDYVAAIKKVWETTGVVNLSQFDATIVVLFKDPEAEPKPNEVPEEKTEKGEDKQEGSSESRELCPSK